MNEFRLQKNAVVRKVLSWQDMIVDFGDVAEQEYSVREVGWGGVIYQGKAIRRPMTTSLTINVRPILAEIAERSFPQVGSFSGYWAEGDVPTYAIVIKGASGSLESVDNLQVFYDWTYKPTPEPLLGADFTSDPITNEIDRRQVLMCSKCGEMGGDFVAVIPTDDGDLEYNLGATSVVGTGWVNLNDFPEAKDKVFIRATFADGFTYEKEYRIVDSCAKYALYYLNERGGWDSLLIKGNGVESDEYTRKMYRRPIDNNIPTEREETTYLTEVDRTYELNTGWLLRDAGRKMHHIIGSPQVFLFDLEEQTIKPVTITDKTCRYSDYKNNGGKLVNWTINVKVAQRMYRR